ncbi:hypothetical protein [uncultured Pseudacidovorax sp.]|uniref:hypothetical protein n=1 Tax=uncultured Pseudacidovorax sp. TaxID=679313 RepID=UPI0025EF2511|nr:hypothetical protein [uncultured Pseudacidovorax sp.]
MDGEGIAPAYAEGARITRVVDFRLPLPWLLVVAFAIVSGGFGMYYKLDRLMEDVGDLKISMKAGNSSTAMIQGELSILKFRIENLEAERRAAERK